MPVLDQNRLSLNDEPAYVDLVLQQQSPWVRQLKMYNTKTRTVRDIQGKTFMGTIRDQLGSVITSFAFSIQVDNSFIVTLTKGQILALNLGYLYSYDWFLIDQDGIGEKVFTGTLMTVYSNTVVP